MLLYVFMGEATRSPIASNQKHLNGSTELGEASGECGVGPIAFSKIWAYSRGLGRNWAELMFIKFLLTFKKYFVF